MSETTRVWVTDYPMQWSKAIRGETMKKSKGMCSGCYNNDYNHGLGGSKECWSFADAEIIKRLEVHINQSPPYNADNARPMMSCYRKPQWVFVDPKNLTEEGFWK